MELKYGKGDAEATLFSSDRETFADGTAIIVPNIVYIVRRA